jgi:hypothetical protein
VGGRLSLEGLPSVGSCVGRPVTWSQSILFRNGLRALGNRLLMICGAEIIVVSLMAELGESLVVSTACASTDLLPSWRAQDSTRIL